MCHSEFPPHLLRKPDPCPFPRLCLWHLCVCSFLAAAGLSQLWASTLPTPCSGSGHPSWGLLAGAECWQGLSRLGTVWGMRLKVLRLPGSAELGRPQTHGKRSGQLSHSSPVFPPWPAGSCPGCTVALFPSLPAGGFHVSSSGDGNIPGLLWCREQGVARNWGPFCPWGDCPQQGHPCQGLAFPLLYGFRIYLLEMGFNES